MVFIYILKLQQNKFYIGKTNNPNFRLKDHNNGNGSTWTKKYNPIKLVELIPNCDDFDEDKYTLKYMDLVGIDNVRGGSFCRIKLSDENKNTIKNMLNGTTDKCYKCGEDGHFASKCPKKQSNSKFNMIIKNNNKIIKDSIKLLRESDDIFDEYSDYEDTDDSEEDFTFNYEVFGCQYCGKEFETQKGATFHENVHCKYKNNSYDDESDSCEEDNYTYSYKPKKTNSSKCYRCGRSGHFAGDCFAKKHVKGFWL